MNNLLNAEISRFSIVGILVLGVLIYLLLRLVRMAFSRFMQNRTFRQYFQRFWPLVETAIWLIFIISAFATVLSNNFQYDLVILAIMGLTLWGFYWLVIKDWLAGVIFKLRNIFQTGQLIKVGEIRGTVQQLGDMTMEIEQEDGEIAVIPYSQLSGQIYLKGTTTRKGQATTHRIEVEIPKDCPVDEARARVQNAILLSPWWGLQQKPQINILEESENNYRFETKIIAPDRRFALALEENVQHLLKNKIIE